jgi:hypothetical protein
METVGSSEPLVFIYQTTRRHIPEVAVRASNPTLNKLALVLIICYKINILFSDLQRNGRIAVLLRVALLYEQVSVRNSCSRFLAFHFRAAVIEDFKNRIR